LRTAANTAPPGADAERVAVELPLAVPSDRRRGRRDGIRSSLEACQLSPSSRLRMTPLNLEHAIDLGRMAGFFASRMTRQVNGIPGRASADRHAGAKRPRRRRAQRYPRPPGTPSSPALGGVTAPPKTLDHWWGAPRRCRRSGFSGSSGRPGSTRPDPAIAKPSRSQWSRWSMLR
jgi:hypothetical protein